MAGKNITTKAQDEKQFLTKQEQANPFIVFQAEMNRLFDGFFRGFGLDFFEKRPGTFNPSIDITDTGKALKVTAELPGIDDTDIDISMSRETLTIKGEKKEEKEEKGESYHRMERSYGSFTRTISLPVEIEADKIKATFKKGLLTIILPKAEKVLKETRKIAIMTE